MEEILRVCLLHNDSKPWIEKSTQCKVRLCLHMGNIALFPTHTHYTSPHRTFNTLTLNSVCLPEYVWDICSVKRFECCVAHSMLFLYFYIQLDITNKYIWGFFSPNCTLKVLEQITLVALCYMSLAEDMKVFVQWDFKHTKYNQIRLCLSKFVCKTITDWIALRLTITHTHTPAQANK